MAGGPDHHAESVITTTTIIIIIIIIIIIPLTWVLADIIGASGSSTPDSVAHISGDQYSNTLSHSSSLLTTTMQADQNKLILCDTMRSQKPTNSQLVYHATSKLKISKQIKLNQKASEQNKSKKQSERHKVNLNNNNNNLLQSERNYSGLVW